HLKQRIDQRRMKHDSITLVRCLRHLQMKPNVGVGIDTSLDPLKGRTKTVPPTRHPVVELRAVLLLAATVEGIQSARSVAKMYAGLHSVPGRDSSAQVSRPRSVFDAWLGTENPYGIRSIFQARCNQLAQPTLFLDGKHDGL